MEIPFGLARPYAALQVETAGSGHPDARDRCPDSCPDEGSHARHWGSFHAFLEDALELAALEEPQPSSRPSASPAMPLVGR
jgi:hypothetical protein